MRNAGERGRSGTAFELIESIDKPVVVVPPDVARAGALSRVIVPLEGTLSSSLAPRHLIEIACDANLDVVVLHVHDEASLPAFTDQPQHETDAWAEEFLARYVPSRFGDVRLEVRVGRRNEEVLRAAEELDADLIALGWSQDLAPGRAPVVRGARAWTHSGDARPRLSCGDAVLRARKEYLMDKVAIIARLKAGAEARAAELLAQGAPFDTNESGLERHVTTCPPERSSLCSRDPRSTQSSTRWSVSPSIGRCCVLSTRGGHSSTETPALRDLHSSGSMAACERALDESSSSGDRASADW